MAWAGFTHGLRTLPGVPREGIKRIVLPVSYWRTPEFSYVWRRLPPEIGAGHRVFDLGSPKQLAFMIADASGAHVVASDILPDPIATVRRVAERRITRRGSVEARVSDGRALEFEDASFDAVFSVSVLEHIPDDGDSAAIRELIRVTRPGGTIIVTVPYDRNYRETFVDRDVYERARGDSAEVFFERHYDEESLRLRLIDMPGVELVDIEIWGEGRVRMARALRSIGRLDLLAAPFEPVLSRLFLHRIEGNGAYPTPDAAFFTLRRTADGGALTGPTTTGSSAAR